MAVTRFNSAGRPSSARPINGAVLVLRGSDRQRAAIEEAALDVARHGWRLGEPFGFIELANRSLRRPPDSELIERCGGARSYCYRTLAGAPIAIVTMHRRWGEQAAGDVSRLAMMLGLSPEVVRSRWQEGAAVVWRRPPGVSAFRQTGH